MKQVLFSDFERMISEEMLNQNLHPLNKDDIQAFWKNKLPEDIQEDLFHDS